MRLAAGFAALLLSASANATFLYAQDGTQISKGDSVAKVNRHMGRADSTDYRSICLREKRDICKEWGSVEIRQYYVKDYYWTMTIFNGKVNKLKWSR